MAAEPAYSSLAQSLVRGRRLTYTWINLHQSQSWETVCPQARHSCDLSGPASPAQSPSLLSTSSSLPLAATSPSSPPSDPDQ